MMAITCTNIGGDNLDALFVLAQVRLDAAALRCATRVGRSNRAACGERRRQKSGQHAVANTS